MAGRAYMEHTGARGLLTVFERLLISFEKQLPSTEIKELTVDKPLIDDPKQALRGLILQDGISRFQKNFLLQHGTYLDFDKEAKEFMQEKAEQAGRKIKDLCEELFADYYHGMRLMNLDNFTINREAIEHPQDYLADYIKNYYKK
jgi:ATP-dependent protease Clp ATPase subunit